MVKTKIVEEGMDITDLLDSMLTDGEQQPKDASDISDEVLDELSDSDDEGEVKPIPHKARHRKGPEELKINHLKSKAKEEKKRDDVLCPPTIMKSPHGASVMSRVVTPNVPAAAPQPMSLSSAIGNPLDNDNLLSAIRNNKSSTSLLRAIMQEIAEEAAYIKAWRSVHWDSGEDLSEATFKRIKMLKHLVETVMEQEKIKKDSTSGKVDFHGEAFQKVLKFFLETILGTFKKVNIPAQYEDIFFTALAKDFDGFEKNAERIYYGKE